MVFVAIYPAWYTTRVRRCIFDRSPGASLVSLGPAAVAGYIDPGRKSAAVQVQVPIASGFVGRFVSLLRDLSN